MTKKAWPFLTFYFYDREKDLRVKWQMMRFFGIVAGSWKEQKVLAQYELISLETLEAFMRLGLYQTKSERRTIFLSLISFFVPIGYKSAL